MLSFTTTILQFEKKGEKSGWTYIEIPADIAEQLLPGNKKSFHVKGSLDDYSFLGISLLPMGSGNFIMALNAAIRKNVRKGKGAMLRVKIEADKKTIQTPSWIKECLEDEPAAKEFFHQLPKGYQRYFVRWIESAKTESTKTKRLAQAVTALSRGQGFGEMIKENKDKDSLEF